MASTMKEWQIEQDRRLDKFSSHKEYLDSLVAPEDLVYLRGADPSQLAELGYRSTGETLNKEKFERRLRAVRDSLFPCRSVYNLDNAGILIRDPLLRELGFRERANRMGVLATIVHVQMMTPFGHELSGYIDYADRLSREDWKPYFTGVRKLVPTPQDLAYYHWRMERSTAKSTSHFKVLQDPERGLLFVHRRDRLVINVNPARPPGPNTTRTPVPSLAHIDAVLLDHVVRQSC